MRAMLVITIDVEEDSWDQFISGDDSLENLRRIPALQALFDRYGAIPTYLLTYPVAVDRRAMAMFTKIHDAGHCEIGAHCHPWNTPPVRETSSQRNTYLCYLPAPLVREKIERLTTAIEERLGHRPVSFRAGRWGFGPNVATAIRDLGYRIDSSITPYWDWREFGGPDFSHALAAPYFFDPERVLERNPHGALIEVPPTIGFLQRDSRRAARLRSRIMHSPAARLHLVGALDRIKLLSFRWLTPELWNGDEMVSLANAALRNGCPILNMTFHSVSMLPGRSEFVKSEEEVATFLKNIEAVLAFGAKSGIGFSSLQEAGAALRGMRA